MQDLREALRSAFDGEVEDDDAALSPVSRDFGRIVTRRPRLRVRPAHVADVATVLRMADDRRIQVAARATGHSQGGQSLTDSGVVLDLSGLDRVLEVDRDQGFAEVEAGANWRQLLLPLRDGHKLPPVVTDNVHVSVGGTVSAGGLGPGSFRWGAQAGLCEALEVVTATGDILRCSPQQHTDVFNFVRAGLGRFGVITKIRFPLVEFPPELTAFQLRFPDPEELVRGIRALSGDDAVTALAGHVVGEGQGGWVSELLVAARADWPLSVKNSAPLGRRQMIPYEFLERFGETFREWRRAAEEGRLAYPWIEAFVPIDAAAECVRETMRLLPTSAAGGSRILVWPVRATDLPMLAMPTDEVSILVGALPAVSPSALSSALDGGRRLDAFYVSRGGKRYLSGWVDYDGTAWRRHFGAAWADINRAKQALDPRGTLANGFLTFEPMGAP